MIDWTLTAEKFGYKTSSDLISHKRPKVTCLCDSCKKPRDITVRVKSRIINNQMNWLCPSCVCLGRSSQISDQMTSNWQNDDYRLNQMTIKQRDDYLITQAEKSKLRWLDSDYRNKLETGIDTDKFIKTCQEKFGDEFNYKLSSFINWKHKISLQCKTCKFEFDKMPLLHLSHGSCPSCRLPIALKNIIKNSESPIIGDRVAIKPLELDLYWPDHKFAIEYHGLYWHSYDRHETSAEKLRHQHKAQICTINNIKLFQMFDYEWATKKDLICSMLAHAFGKSQQFYARKLTITKLTNKESTQFFAANHLQGCRHAAITLGLVDKETIIMAMSFSKIKDGYEVIRMATKIGCHVSGGASRLLSQFVKTYSNQVYTFADLRYSTAETYKKIGFKELWTTHPGYFYYKNDTILSRQRCQKHRLPQILEKFDINLSEPENMFANGYRRVWDAGHIKLRLE